MTTPTDAELATAGLRLAVSDGVATITLHRPERKNAQTPLMWRTLARIGASLGDHVRVVVVRGEGPVFSAGLDLAMLDPTRGPAGAGGDETVAGLLALPDKELAATVAQYQAGFTFLHDPRFVSVAVVRGPAIGAGLQLALACDLRVLATDARLCMKEAALGLVPDLAGTKPLVESVGYARALEICATARHVEAAEAVAIGLANLAVPPDDLDEAVADLVAALTAAPVGAVREITALLQGAGERSLTEQTRLEREAQVRRLRELAATS